MNYIRNGFILLIIELITNTFQADLNLKFNYPTSITLSNKNIFVIEENGIHICDPNFTQKIKTVVSFDSDEDKISTPEKLSKVILIKRSAYIISLISYKIYFFNTDGSFLYNSQRLIENFEPKYFTLSPISKTDNIIYYVVSYFDKNIKLNLLYYKFNIREKVNTKISTTIEDNLKERDYYLDYDGYYCYYYDDQKYWEFKNQGLSCLNMYDSYMYDNGRLSSFLVCFFVTKEYPYEYLEELVFKVENNKIEKSLSYEHSYIKFNHNTITQIKSESNNVQTLSLVCIITSDNNSICYKFKLNYGSKKTQFYSPIQSNKKCSSELYGMQVTYLYETEQIIFSCLLNGIGGIQATIVQKNLKIKESSLIQLVGCTQIYGHSIIYSNNDYYIISDMNCSTNKTKYFTKLIGGDEYYEEKNTELKVEINNTEIINKFEEEEEMEEEEEEKFNPVQHIICPTGCRICIDFSNEIICLECNTTEGYFPLSNSDPPNLEKCINNEEKEKNYQDYYLDLDTGFYRPCFEKCKTCSKKGDGKNNNCLTCAIGYILEPDFENKQNCVPKYKYLYYYNEYDQYSTTDSPNCPENFPIKIQEKNKCIDKCKKDPTYKYSYNNICYEHCPNNTIDDDGDFICKDDPSKCILTRHQIFISNYSNINEEINSVIKKYAIEYNYTNNHVSVINLGDYDLTLYKNKTCVSELAVSSNLIDLSSASSKVKNHYNMDEKEELIVGIVSNSSGYETFEVYDPQSGVPLKIFDICQNDSYSVEKSLIEKLTTNSKVNFNDLQEMANQDINVVDLSDPFYNDICFHYTSKFNKDVPLKDRALIYYPNISLCDEECELESVYIQNWTAKCNCQFDSGNNKFKDNALYESQLGEMDELLSMANINVMKCYKDIFVLEFFKKSSGNFIILSLILVNIICTIIYFLKSFFYIKKYIFNITGKYLILLKTQNPTLNVASIDNSFKTINKKIPFIEEKKNKSSPPPKTSSDENIINNDENVNNNNNDTVDKNENSINNNDENVNNNRENNNNIINNNKNININNNNNFEGKVIKKNKRKRGMSVKNNLDNLDVFIKSKNNNFGNLNLKTNNLKNGDFLDNNNLNSNEMNSSSKYGINSRTKTHSTKRKNLFSLNKLNNKALNLDDKNAVNNLEMLIKDDLDINIEEYLSTDPDDMDYDESLRRDNRKFCRYFWDKIQANQILINTFYFKEYLKPRPIKFILLSLQIDLYFFINGLFYNEEYVKKIFDLQEDTLSKAFLRFMDNLFYAFLVGVIINYIIEFFFIEEKKLRVTLKREKDNILILKYEMIQIIKDIHHRYITFIIITFVILIFTWYHLYCFNNIYPHMQKEWLVFSVLIILSVQILSILASLLETILRFLSFRFKSEKLYKLSQLLS